MTARILVSLFLCFMFSGCVVRPSAYISSQTDPEYFLSKTEKIYVLSSDKDSISHRQFDAMLKDEMKVNGFNVVDSAAEAKYILFSDLEETTSSGTAYMYLPNTSRTTGYVGNTRFSGSTTTNEAVPYHYTNTTQKIYLDLHLQDDLLKHNPKAIWEGYIGVDKKDYKNNARAFVRELLKVFGTNYEADTQVNITQ